MPNSTLTSVTETFLSLDYFPFIVEWAVSKILKTNDYEFLLEFS